MGRARRGQLAGGHVDRTTVTGRTLGRARELQRGAPHSGKSKQKQKLKQKQQKQKID